MLPDSEGTSESSGGEESLESGSESEEVASRIDFDTRRCNSRILKSLEQHNKRSDDWYCKNIEI